MEIEEPDAGCSVEEAAEHWKMQAYTMSEALIEMETEKLEGAAENEEVSLRHSARCNALQMACRFAHGRWSVGCCAAGGAGGRGRERGGGDRGQV